MGVSLDKVFGDYMNNALSQEFLDFLEVKGFLTAPASKSHHGNYFGGLYEHSVDVMLNLTEFTQLNGLQWQRRRSPYIVGLFHDICKVDDYIFTPNGIDYNPDARAGHGERSVIILKNFIDLTEEEELCIRWHMGAFDEIENWARYKQASIKYPNVLWSHHADIVASYGKEKLV